MFNRLRDQLFNVPTGEDMGQRTEILTTLSLGVLSTLVPIIVYRHPVTLVTSLVTNLVGFFVLYHAFRGQYKYLAIFPILTSFSVCIVTVFEGHGTHDLLWMGNLGLFLLANIHSRRRLRLPIFLGFLMIGTFAATGFAEMAGLIQKENAIETTIQYIILNSFFFAAMMTAIIAIFHRHYSLLQIISENRNVQDKTNRELQEVNQTLESRVESRTSELIDAYSKIQERASRLQTISEISQEISSGVELHLQELLNRTCQIISKNLDFYHVGIFLLDESREYAVLQAANSEGGQRMLERHHQLRVGGTGIVGYVAQSGHARIALDTGSDAVFFNNPDLPKTRSEMAVPLKYGSQVIGVLDIQSTIPSVFKDEDANLLGTLSNQLTLAINNTKLNEQSGFNFQFQGRMRGKQISHRQKQSGYSFSADGTISTRLITNDPMLEKAMETGETAIQERPSKERPAVMAVPVKFRDKVIGVIHIEAAEENRKWTEDEITVVQSISDRAAFALENARLFEETSRRAEQEENIAHITSQIGSSTDFDHILQTTIEELGRTLGATRTFIQLESSAKDSGPENQHVTD